MTLILQSNVTITNPIFPNLIDIDPDLGLILRASDVEGLASGDTIESIVSRGQLPLRTRTFDTATNGWLLPTYSTARGEPTFRFDRSHQFRNYASANAESVISTPLAVFWRVWIDSFIFSGSSLARLLSSGAGTSANLTFRPSNVVGQFVLQSPNFSHVLDTPMRAAEWGVVGVLFNGENSRFVGPDGSVRAVQLDMLGIEGFRIGGNSNTSAAGSGLAGDIAEMRVYTRAMADGDLTATLQSMVV